MKHLVVAALAAVFWGPLSGCQSDRAEKLFETARFEEQQFNDEHARQLYREILDCCPDSPSAARAKERLAALEKSGT